MSRYVRNFLIILILTIAAVVIFNVWTMEQQLPYIDYTTFLTNLEKGGVKDVHLKGGQITGHDSYDQPFSSFSPDTTSLVAKLQLKNVVISASSDKPSPFSSFWTSVLPVLIIMAGWMYFMIRQKGGSGTSGFAKSKAIISSGSKPSVTFDDVAGVPEAKDELFEIIEFLRNPEKYTRLGGRIPKGVLLQGPPGTGKTLLAKAIAGEANVPFFSISGSDFVEMFVGVGASRVRDLFKQAKKSAPCIIFIDEIDAVGRLRGASSSQGGQDEREQTLNALLVEMDGFGTGDTVILVAATNRPDVLDPALLRPGRFDRQVTIMAPDVKGREEILKVYADKIVMAEVVQLKDIARNTPGFTGAELANLMNESALMAARKDKQFVEMADVEEAKDKILMGAERKGLVLSEKQRRTTAYHEAGHAIMAKLLPNTDPLHKITIIPRGRALGMTQQMPIDDRQAYSKEYLVNRIKILLGGRTSEEIVFNKFSTGASSDLQSATDIATKMVCEWGMSDLLGPRAYTKPDQGFLGGAGTQRMYSEETASAIDREINKIIEDCYQEAMIILEGKIGMLHRLAALLLEKETIGPDEVEGIVEDSVG
ncbi:MAG: ATP-dependent zinc metalloprotease FtsH [Proteobacteria bacterium]|nr:ATP-dependent zinc metalloprotease FtsH [Pseudomonadota bacterium]MBU1710766.1 ATP-dependent zinc metalloprotease FtsH [Pseudomonadota bacterium]